MIWMLVVAIGVVVSLAIIFGNKSKQGSYITFPCRTCGTEQNVSIAETMRYVREAHGKGTLGELTRREIKCMKCGASQTSDWLMNPRTKKILSEMDAGVYRDATAQEYMNMANESIPGGGSALAPPAPDPLAPPAIPAPKDSAK